VHVHEAALTEAGFLDDFFRSFLGRMVSLLFLVRKVPVASDLPPLRSAGAMDACGIEVTVSVVTVMPRSAVSAADLAELSDSF
jgi:hypothetical protein